MNPNLIKKIAVVCLILFFAAFLSNNKTGIKLGLFNEIFSAASAATTPSITIISPNGEEDGNFILSDRTTLQVKNAILYETLHNVKPERSIDELIQILKETNTDLILRATGRAYIYIFDKMKDNNLRIKAAIPNIKIIGNLYAQTMQYTYTDELTRIIYDQDQTYAMAFDPAKFHIASPTKYEFQTANKSYVAAKNWWPDVTNEDYQTLYLHQARRLLDTGVDGIWVDMPFWQAIQLRSWDNNNAGIEDSMNAAIYLFKEIKKMKTLSGETPILSTWIPRGWMTSYFSEDEPLFDFLTASFSTAEIRTIVPGAGRTDDPDGHSGSINWDLIKDQSRIYFNNVPILAYIDWSFGKHQLWWFSQNIADVAERKAYQENVLTVFTDFLKSKNITWAYPVHGGVMCSITGDTSSPCNALSFGQWHIYDSKAPEFQTYNKIKELMTGNQAPATTFLDLTVYQHGIWKSGDNTNPDGTLSNKKPVHPTINADLELFNAENQLIGQGHGPLKYSSTSGNFKGIIGIYPNTFPSGNYYLKIKTGFHLKRLIPGILTITAGQTNTIPAATLVTGNSNNDNRLNILDYNLLLGCYSDLATATACDPNKKLATDLNDDSFVNQTDYNLFLREIATQSGE